MFRREILKVISMEYASTPIAKRRERTTYTARGKNPPKSLSYFSLPFLGKHLQQQQENNTRNCCKIHYTFLENLREFLNSASNCASASYKIQKFLRKIRHTTGLMIERDNFSN